MNLWSESWRNASAADRLAVQQGSQSQVVDRLQIISSYRASIQGKAAGAIRESGVGPE